MLGGDSHALTQCVHHEPCRTHHPRILIHHSTGSPFMLPALTLLHLQNADCLLQSKGRRRLKQEGFVSHSGASFSKQGLIIKGLSYYGFSLISHDITRAGALPETCSPLSIGYAMFHAPQQQDCSSLFRRLAVRDRLAGQSGSGLVTFHWRQRRHTVTF